MDAINCHYLFYCSIYSWDLKVGPLIDLSVFLKIYLVVLVSIDFLNFRQKRGCLLMWCLAWFDTSGIGFLSSFSSQSCMFHDSCIFEPRSKNICCLILDLKSGFLWSEFWVWLKLSNKYTQSHFMTCSSTTHLSQSTLLIKVDFFWIFLRTEDDAWETMLNSYMRFCMSLWKIKKYFKNKEILF